MLEITPISAPVTKPNIIYIGINDITPIFLVKKTIAKIWPRLCATAPNILEVIIENLTFLRKTIKTIKLSTNPDTDIPNLTKLPSKMPIIISLKILIIKLNLIPIVNIPIIVIILLRPTLMPKPPKLKGNIASIYDNMSIKDNKIMLWVNLLICVKFSFDIIANIW